LGNRSLIIVAIIWALSIATPSILMADGCPTEPGWDYTTNGPDKWGSLFPALCGLGVRQSPINIDRSSAISTSLPKLRFVYNVADVVTLDHDDQTLVGHGEGNYILIGNTRYDLVNIHAHTPAEHTINGKRYPLELHFVHLSETGQFAAVGVLVESGQLNPGIIKPPSNGDPSTVDFNLVDLIPNNRQRFTYDGSLTTPGSDPTTVGCPETILFTVMNKPIQMSADQIKAFENSGFACWSTTNTARPVTPVNNRFVFFSAN
jgi:carbonic anhydrase